MNESCCTKFGEEQRMNSKLNITTKQFLISSSNLVGGNQGETVRRKVKDCSSRLGQLAGMGGFGDTCKTNVISTAMQT
jgi:hypothetical protein